MIVQESEYDEHGNIMKNTNAEFQPLGFAGGLYDSDTKLIRFGARDYDPTVGRWTTKDPIGFAGGDTNLYAYVGGDPMSKVDPDGKNAVLALRILAGLCAVKTGYDAINLTLDPANLAKKQNDIQTEINNSRRELSELDPVKSPEKCDKLNSKINSLESQKLTLMKENANFLNILPELVLETICTAVGAKFL